MGIVPEWTDDDIAIEVVEQEKSGVLGYGVGRKKILTKTSSNFRDSFSVIANAAKIVEEQLKDRTNVDDAEMTFGLKFSGKGNAYISKGLDEASFVVTLKWKQIQETSDY